MSRFVKMKIIKTICPECSLPLDLHIHKGKVFAKAFDGAPIIVRRAVEPIPLNARDYNLAVWNCPACGYADSWTEYEKLPKRPPLPKD